MSSFFCDQCGECCRHVDRVPQLAAFDLGNGTCQYLVNNLCSVYETRPDICRVDAMYEKFFSRVYTREEYDRLNTEACYELKKEYLLNKD